MTWFDNLLNHFALYPAHLFVLLFVMALSKSTVLISSVLPPASVMLLAGITVSQGSMHPALTWLAVVMGATAGSVLNYHIGQLMGHTRMVTRFTSKHANKFLRVQHQLQKNGVIVLFTSRFLAVLRYIVPLAAGMLRLNAVKVYAVSLLSALCVGGAVCRCGHRHQRLIKLQAPHSAVHQQFRSHRVARLVGGQIKRGFCQLGRRAHSAQRHQLNDLCHHRVKRLVA